MSGIINIECLYISTTRNAYFGLLQQNKYTRRVQVRAFRVFLGLFLILFQIRLLA